LLAKPYRLDDLARMLREAITANPIHRAIKYAQDTALGHPGNVA
jgi:hypothetical protein